MLAPQMTTVVEAHSLSSLNSLFANPPAYPRNPTHSKHAPVVLYILKVPGSQDVFLTPLKPPAKASITLEGVQSCLYYLHVTTLEDEEFSRSLDEERRSAETDRNAEMTPIMRKPLPTAAVEDDLPAVPPPLPPRASTYSHSTERWESLQPQAARNMARDRHLRLRTSSENNEATYRRHALGPRTAPTHTRLQSADAAVALRNPFRAVGVQNTAIQRPSSLSYRKPLPTMSLITDQPPARSTAAHCLRDSHGDASDESDEVRKNTPSSATGQWWENRPASRARKVLSPNDNPQVDFGKIVLIRRDPGSGSQWNVGTIICQTTASNQKFDTPVAHVQIHTPGYQKFAHNERQPKETSPTSRTNASTINNVSADGEGFHPASPSSHVQPFSRSVNFAWSGKGQGAQQRQRSDESTTNLQSHGAFTSLWGGTCSFSTGVDGKSLRCRHSLPMNSSTGKDSTTEVAELRFNLPWLRLKSRDPNQKDPVRRGIRKFQRQTGSQSSVGAVGSDPFKFSRHTSAEGILTPLESESEDQDVLDLTLGREKAGGGFRGRSAKLGKLIIEDEGLKMADLVVASCMAVWWQHFLASKR